MKIVRLVTIPLIFVMCWAMTRLAIVEGINVSQNFFILWSIAIVICCVIKAKTTLFLSLLYWVFMAFMGGMSVFNQFTLLEDRLARLPFEMLKPVWLYEDALISSVVATAICVIFIVFTSICFFLDKRYYSESKPKERKKAAINVKEPSKTPKT